MLAKKVHQDVGFNILKYRRLKNLTQEKVAADAGISRTSLSAIECGTASCLLSTLMKIAKALDVEPNMLLKTDAKQDDLCDEWSVCKSKNM